MVTLEKCSELYTSLRRIKRRCNFKYSKTSNQEYSMLANTIGLLLVSLERNDIDDVDFEELKDKRDILYLRMRCIDDRL